MNSYLNNRRNIFSEVDKYDFLGRLKPSAIMEYFQDSATLHAAEIGVGYEKLKGQNMFWVLSRMSAVIDRLPTFGEELIVTTFPHAPGIVDALRDYYISDVNGNSLIRGTSRWCVLDVDSKAIRKCSSLFDYDKSQYNPNFAVPDGNPQLSDITEIVGDSKYYNGKVRITDLDRNIHMNNARYADIVMNSCNFDFYATHTIRRLDFNFLSEMKIDDEYTVNIKNCTEASYFEAHGVNNNKTIFRARILWN